MANVFVVVNVYGEVALYLNAWSHPLSLWQGDYANITVADESGECKITFPMDNGWAKVGCQALGGAGFLDLTGYTEIQFKARGSENGIRIHFGMGSWDLWDDSCGEHLCSTTMLTASFTDCSICLMNQNMTTVKNLWWFEIIADENGIGNNPLTVYIDDVKYVGGTTCAPIPEPSTMLLFGTGLLGLLGFKRKKKV